MENVLRFCPSNKEDGTAFHCEGQAVGAATLGECIKMEMLLRQHQGGI